MNPRTFDPRSQKEGPVTNDIKKDNIMKAVFDPKDPTKPESPNKYLARLQKIQSDGGNPMKRKMDSGFGQEDVITFTKAPSNPDEKTDDLPQGQKLKRSKGNAYEEQRDLKLKDGKPGQNMSIDLEKELKIAPWTKKSTLRIHNPLVRLHNEIVEFYEYIKPSKEDETTRMKTFERIKTMIVEGIQGTEVYLFGSYSTKLYLPDGDIDFVVVNNEYTDRNLMNKVAKVLLKYEEQFEAINIIRSAKVPIIKFADKVTKINFDVSFNKMDGVYQLEEVAKALKSYPEMKYLIMIAKLMLRQRELHETFRGGVGSFLLFCIVLNFLREFRKEQFYRGEPGDLKNVTLGEYLIRFMEYYGVVFDTANKMIIMTNGGDVVDKPRNRDPAFSLISPQDSIHDIGNAAFRIKDVFNLFKNRYNFAVNYNFRPSESVLKYIVNPSLRPFAL